MRRVCLTLPTHRACPATIRAVAEEAAHGARHFGVEVHLLILDSSEAAVLAGHRRTVAALPPAPAWSSTTSTRPPSGPSCAR
ncbi:hypothetical protein STANM309S_00834 [Streptomyces tanashiensis]